MCKKRKMTEFWDTERLFPPFNLQSDIKLWMSSSASGTKITWLWHKYKEFPTKYIKQNVLKGNIVKKNACWGQVNNSKILKKHKGYDNCYCRFSVKCLYWVKAVFHTHTYVNLKGLIYKTSRTNFSINCSSNCSCVDCHTELNGTIYSRRALGTILMEIHSACVSQMRPILVIHCCTEIFLI